MNIEEMKAKWTEYDAKLDSAIRLNETRVRMLEARGSLRGMFWFGLGGMMVNGVGAMLLGEFIAGHLSEPGFWVPALVLDAGILAHLAFSVRQWVELRALDYGAPIVTIQRRLAALRLLRVRLAKWTLWLAPLLWVPLLIVGLEGLLGLNAYEIFPVAFLVANLAFGVAFLLTMIWLARRLEGRLDAAPWIETMMDHLAGRSLTRATAMLHEIADLEREPLTE